MYGSSAEEQLTGVDLDGDSSSFSEFNTKLHITATTGEVTRLAHHQDGLVAHILKSGNH